MPRRRAVIQRERRCRVKHRTFGIRVSPGTGQTFRAARRADMQTQPGASSCLRTFAVASLITLASAIALYAAIPDGNKTYTACVLKSVGTIRLIDPSLPASNLMSHCTPLETQITWNEQGPP